LRNCFSFQHYFNIIIITALSFRDAEGTLCGIFGQFSAAGPALAEWLAVAWGGGALRSAPLGAVLLTTR